MNKSEGTGYIRGLCIFAEELAAQKPRNLLEVVLSSMASSIHCGFEGSPPDFVTIITACWRMVTCLSTQEWCCV